MQGDDAGLRAAIRKASMIVKESASRGEAASLDYLERSEAAVADMQSRLRATQALSGEIMTALTHAGRTSLSGVGEINGALGRYASDALADTVRSGRSAISARCAKEVVDLSIDLVSRRSQAVFALINELNGIARDKGVAAWSPLAETLRRSETSSRPAAA